MLTREEKMEALRNMEHVGAHARETAHHMMEADISTVNPDLLGLVWGAAALVLHTLGDAFADLAVIVREDLEEETVEEKRERQVEEILERDRRVIDGA